MNGIHSPSCDLDVDCSCTSTSTRPPIMNPVNKSTEFYTPRWIFEGLGISFDLDPCAPLGECPSKKYCRRFYSAQGGEDGLLMPWHGVVFVNPPWTRKEKARWMAKVYSHGNGIALVRGGIDSRWLHDNPPDAMLLFPRRVRYLGETDRIRGATGAFEPSMLLSYGQHDRLINCKLDGLKLSVRSR